MPAIPNLADLLRVKRAREQRAIARAAQAQHAEAAASHAHTQAQQAQQSHAAERPVLEAEAYTRLLAATLPAMKVQAESALLSGLVAITGVLAARTGQAAATRQEAADATLQARAQQADAMRGTQAALAITETHARHAGRQAELDQELEQEDLSPALQPRPARPRT